MNSVKIVAKILFYLTNVLAFGYFIICAYSMLALLTGWSLKIFKEGTRFAICYPFTDTNFLIGDYNISYIIIDFLMMLFLVGLFFWLLSNVFKLFFQPKLFTQNGVTHLKRFYIANMVLPTIALVLASIYTEVEQLAIFFVVIHFFLGIFAFFLAAIFQQGVNLQNEQDLII